MNRINITIVLLLLFLSCCFPDKAVADNDIEPDVTISLGDEIFVSPFEMVDCATYRDGGSRGFKMEDKNGKVLEILEYRGLGEVWDVYWGTWEPGLMDPSKKITEPEKVRLIFDQARLALSRNKKQDDRIDKIDKIDFGILYDYCKDLSVETENGKELSIINVWPGYFKSIGNESRFIPTNHIPLKIGDAFGFEFRLPDIPDGDSIVIDVVVKLPKAIYKGKGKLDVVKGKIQFDRTSVDQNILWNFEKEEPEYLIAGTWTFSLYNKGNLLISRKFHIEWSVSPPSADESSQKTQKTLDAEMSYSERMNAKVWVFVQGYVKSKLPTPATAKFPFDGHKDIILSRSNSYICESWVDAQNDSGALVRMNFSAIVDPGVDGYTMKYFKFKDVEGSLDVN